MSTAARSARSRPLRRPLRHRQVPQGPFELLGVEARAGLCPVAGRELAAIVDRATAFDPEERYPTAIAMWADLVRVPRRV